MRRALRVAGRHAGLGAALLVLAVGLVPVAVVAAMSLTDPPGRGVYALGTPSLTSWRDPCAAEGMCAALGRSVQVSLLATAVATVLGTLAALGLSRHRVPGRRGVSLAVLVPLALPEVVLGSSLLALLVAAGLGGRLGTATVLVTHVLFCLSFVVVTVRARLAGLDDVLEQAARDLYATPWQAFCSVTLPLLAPGVLGAALLSFSLSFDDFVATDLVSGSTVTFPLFVWGAAERGVPVQVNVVGTALFVVSLAVVAGAEVLARRRGGHLRDSRP